MVSNKLRSRNFNNTSFLLTSTQVQGSFSGTRLDFHQVQVYWKVVWYIIWRSSQKWTEYKYFFAWYMKNRVSDFLSNTFVNLFHRDHFEIKRVQKTIISHQWCTRFVTTNLGIFHNWMCSSLSPIKLRSLIDLTIWPVLVRTFLNEEKKWLTEKDELNADKKN